MSVDREKLRKSLEARFGKREEPKRKLPWRLAVGIIITVVAFVAILLALNSVLAWPDSLLTLGGMLVIAWFGSILAGERIATPRLTTIAATILALGVAASTLGLGVPWKVGIFPSAQEFENFEYRAAFTYFGSENNESLENLGILFPAPRIDNQIAQEEMFLGWALYYLENDNETLTLEATADQIYNLRGERTSTVEIYSSGWQMETSYGPVGGFEIDRLYPREVFQLLAIADKIPKSMASNVTLSIYGDMNGAAFYLHTPKLEQENKTIDLGFEAYLYDQENQLVEAFGGAYENNTWGWYAAPRTV